MLVVSETGGHCGLGGLSGKGSRGEVRVVMGNETATALSVLVMALAFAQHELGSQWKVLNRDWHFPWQLDREQVKKPKVGAQLPQ